MNNADITDPLFLQAVNAIDNGDITLLQSLVKANPRLIRDRLNHPEPGYFQHPYLLWFVADNPIRIPKLAANIVEIARILIDFVKAEAAETAQFQLDYTLGLVATGRIPKECGVQIELIDLLIDSGAKVGDALGALAHGNPEAAEHILKRGGNLTLATAVGLNRITDVERLTPAASPKELLLALTVAAFYSRTELLAYLLKAGADPNGYPENGSGFHSHATPLHQAVYSGSLASVKLLVDAGGRLNLPDKIYGGSPLGWAQYIQNDESPDEETRQRFAKIEEYLKGV